MGRQQLTDVIEAKLRSRPSFAEDGRLRLIDFPIEKFVIAGPGVDFDPANLASEAPGMRGRMLLLRRSIGQPTIGTVKKLGRPDTACHAPKMLRIVQARQRARLSYSMTCYRTIISGKLPDNAFLTHVPTSPSDGHCRYRPILGCFGPLHATGGA